MSMRRMLRASGLAVFAATVLAAGSITLGSTAAMAAGCGGAVAAGTSCTLTGTLTLGAGTLTLTSPSSLSWTGTVTGNTQSIVDTTASDQQLTATDATGSGAGWHITTSATTFTSGGNTLPDTGTFSFGSATSVTSISAPTASCVSTCTLPTNSTTYPVAITTALAPTAVTIYDTSATTGVGAILIGGSTNPNPAGWWVTVPGSTVPGTYTSTITMQIISGP
jgi:hypothetical protein